MRPLNKGLHHKWLQRVAQALSALAMMLVSQALGSALWPAGMIAHAVELDAVET